MEPGSDHVSHRRGRGRLRAAAARALDDQLIEAARSTFIANGYGATSMSALARAAGVSKTTLYAKFPTKADLFRAIIDAQLAEAYAIPDNAAGAATLGEALNRLVQGSMTAGLRPQNLDLNRLILWEAPRFPELAALARARARLGVEHVARLIHQFAVLEQQACRDPAGAAAMFNLLVRGFYNEIFVRPHPPGPAKLREEIADLVAFFLAGRAAW